MAVGASTAVAAEVPDELLTVSSAPMMEDDGIGTRDHGGNPYGCGASISGPHISGHKPEPKTINTFVTSKCAIVPDVIGAHVVLQRKRCLFWKACWWDNVKANWQEVERNKSIKVKAPINCVSSTYRSYGKGWAWVNGVYYVKYLDHTPERYISCD